MSPQHDANTMVTFIIMKWADRNKAEISVVKGHEPDHQLKVR
jgi:hypothetical protein